MQRAPATAEPAADGQGDERSPLGEQRAGQGALDIEPGGLAAVERRLADHRAGEVEQHPPALGVDAGAMGVFEGERAVADHAASVALGVAGIAHVEGGDAQVAALGLVDQAGDAGVAAGAVALADLRLQPLDADGGLLVLGPGRGVVVEVGEIRGDDDRRLRPAPELAQEG